MKMSSDAPRDLAAIERDGYVILERLLDTDTLDEIRRSLEPHLGRWRGRNDFEGHATERVYSLVARGKVFEELVEHPRVLAICDALLEPNYLLTASQAIHIHPGETPQPFHTDDAFYRIARPRPAVSVSTIVAIDDFTPANGATQVVPGSHLWSDEQVGEILARIDFETNRTDRTPHEIADAYDESVTGTAHDVEMRAGSMIVFLGTLVHRGGRNTSDSSRLALSNQYCQPWGRPQENFFLSVERERTAAMSPRVQSLLGYSVHPPFMGHVLGRHPARLLGRRPD